MILDLGDGREIRLPDSWSDDEARAVKRQILRGEVNAERIAELERARDAERSTNELILEQLKKISALLAADRVVVFDPVTGDYTRSKVVPTGR